MHTRRNEYNSGALFLLVPRHIVLSVCMRKLAHMHTPQTHASVRALPDTQACSHVVPGFLRPAARKYLHVCFLGNGVFVEILRKEISVQDRK